MAPPRLTRRCREFPATGCFVLLSILALLSCASEGRRAEPPAQTAPSQQPCQFRSQDVVERYIEPVRLSIMTHPDPLKARNEMIELTGMIFAVKRADGEMVFIPQQQLVKSGTHPRFSTRDNDIILSGMVDSSLETSNDSILKALRLLDTNEKMSVTYETIAKTLVGDSAMPWDTLRNMADEPLPVGISDHFYVRSVTLNRLTTRKFVRLGENQKISGPAISIGGRVYHTYQQEMYSYEVMVEGFPLSQIQKSILQRLRPLAPGAGDVELFRIATDPERLRTYDDKSLLSGFERLPRKMTIGKY